MCASEAIINSRLGIVSDAHKRPLDYSTDTNSHTLKSGIIASRDFKIYEICMKRLERHGTLLQEVN